MIVVRKSQDRGYADHGWLKSFHTFSFASYYDPRFMNFRSLRVINDDFIAGGGGFPQHPHKDMEIITYVIEGELGHKDSMGHASSIHPFEVQVMSAGTGITHSEYNPSKVNPLKLLQIWIQTNQTNHAPRYDQKSFKEEIHNQELTLVVSGNKEDPALFIHQDAKIYIGKLKMGSSLEFDIPSNHHAWVHLIEGELKVGDKVLGPGDAVAVTNEAKLFMNSHQASHFLIFDLA
jgi:hypothetical protein